MESAYTFYIREQQLLNKVLEQQERRLVNNFEFIEENKLDLSNRALTSFKQSDLLVPTPLVEKWVLAKKQLIAVEEEEEINNNNSVPIAVPEQLLHLSAITHLYLFENPIKVISTATFKYVPRLQHLDLTSCSLELIEENAFQGLTNLKSLLLSTNPALKKLNPFVFEGLEALETLDLARCGLTEIDSPLLFHPLCALLKLFLHENPLRRIHPLAFKQQDKLVDLCMFSNELEHIDEDTFAPLVSLRSLNLYPHKLVRVPRGLLRNARSLKFLNIGAKHVECEVEVLEACWESLQRLDGNKDWRQPRVAVVEEEVIVVPTVKEVERHNAVLASYLLHKEKKKLLASLF